MADGLLVWGLWLNGKVKMVYAEEYGKFLPPGLEDMSDACRPWLCMPGERVEQMIADSFWQQRVPWPFARS